VALLIRNVSQRELLISTEQSLPVHYRRSWGPAAGRPKRA
jgi:hypothetical protein